MGQTILDRIGAFAEAEDTDQSDEGGASNTPESAEEGLTVNVPVIGMDGKTADGSMPYEILKRQLGFLR